MTMIGFVGLGNMGTPMVRRLAQGGHELVVHDLQPAAVAALVEEAAGISAAGEPSRIGASCGLVITMLPDSAAVRAAVIGDDEGGGLVQGLRPGSVVVDMSSSAPTATVALGEALAAYDIDLVDAPVSGGVPKARDGSLTIMAGGAPAVVESVAPVLSAMGAVHRTGGLGSGHAAKALNNYVSAAGLLAVSEALVIAARFGLDPRTANDVFKASTGRNNTTDRKVEQYLLNRAFDSGFALDLMVKDVGMARDLARDLALDAPWLEACRALLGEAARALGPGADHTAAFTYLEERLTRAGSKE